MWSAERFRTLAILTGLVCLAAELPAQFGRSRRVDLSDSIDLNKADSAARNRLMQVRSYLDDQQWSEAVETLRQVQEEYGQRLIPLPEVADPKAPERRFVSVRDYCHWQISALPLPALELYRQRVDPLAERWYADGAGRSDVALLQQVVHAGFVSSWGDDALLLLGELALEAGHFDRARECWFPLLPLPTNHAVLQSVFERARTIIANGEVAKLLDELYQLKTGAEPHYYHLRRDRPLTVAAAQELARFWKSEGQFTQLTYPDTPLDWAAIEARLVMVSIAEGDLATAELELGRFRRLYGSAEGKLGGRTVNFTEFLTAQLAAAKAWRMPSAPKSWPMFAGNNERNPLAAADVDIRAVAWRVPLGKVTMVDSELAATMYRPRRSGEGKDALLPHFPVVAQGRVYYCNEYQIFARNLHDGQPCWGNAQGRPPGEIFHHEPAANMRFPSLLGVPRFTLLNHQDKLFARVGAAPTTTVSQAPSGRKSDSFLVCLDLAAEGREMWRFHPETDDWAVEGSPVTDGKLVFIVLRQGGVRSRLYMAALDVDSGRQVWKQFICGADTPGRNEHSEVTHNLLTLHDGTLYCNTNLGAVSALTTDGQWKWLARYNRAKFHENRNRKPAHYYRDVNPVVFHAGLLYAAPSDFDGILALDAATGELAWKAVDPEDAVHLLGVAEGMLVASGDKLWRFDARYGLARFKWPEGERPLGFGRGVISGSRIYFPTRDEIYLFDVGTEYPIRQPIELKIWGSPSAAPDAPSTPGDRNAQGGHLIVAEGYLLIAGTEELLAFKLDGAEEK